MPARVYKVNGKRVPGVTTVLKNLGWGLDGLLYWAWKQGTEDKDFQETRSKAADIGTLVHAKIEAEIKDKYWTDVIDVRNYTDEMYKTADMAMTGWEKWKERVNFSVKASELSLVSEPHKYGGTIDIVEIKDEVSILDIKTSKDIYKKHLVQLAAYGNLYQENYGDEVEAYYILQIKPSGNFSDRYYRPDSEDIISSWEVFKRIRDIHDLGFGINP